MYDDDVIPNFKKKFMRVLTYVDGILTVINEDLFFSGEHEKPDFIECSSFYFEPTLKRCGDNELTSHEIDLANTYIDNFIIPEPTVQEITLVPCVDQYGNYLGKQILSSSYFEVPSTPSNIAENTVWDFEKNEWYTALLADLETGRILGSGKNTNFINSGYFPESLLIKELPLTAQKYNFSEKKIEISMDLVKAQIISKIFQDERNKVLSISETGDYSEVGTWFIQEKEAELYKNDINASTPFIDALLVNRNLNETKEELVEKILSKATNFNIKLATLLGTVQSFVKRIEVLNNLDDLKNIQIEWQSKLANLTL